MRYAIFSDVHGNLEALAAVLEHYQTLQIDKYFCLGDTVGYGADPNGCCNRVREVAEAAILGNHDAAVAERMDFAFYYDAAKRAILWTIDQLSEENHLWLRSLNYTRQVDDVLLSHGSPRDPESYDYIFSVEQAEQFVDNYDSLSRITFIGHSHLTSSFAIDPEGAVKLSGPIIDVLPGKKYIVTVGSVGQPRDYNNRACCIVYDDAAATITYHRVRYDIEVAAQKIFDADLAPSFGKRLFLGI